MGYRAGPDREIVLQEQLLDAGANEARALLRVAEAEEAQQRALARLEAERGRRGAWAAWQRHLSVAARLVGQTGPEVSNEQPQATEQRLARALETLDELFRARGLKLPQLDTPSDAEALAQAQGVARERAEASAREVVGAEQALELTRESLREARAHALEISKLREQLSTQLEALQSNRE